LIDALRGMNLLPAGSSLERKNCIHGKVQEQEADESINRKKY